LQAASTHAIFEVNPGQQQVHTFLELLPAANPLVNRNGVVNGASFSTSAVVAPGSIAALFGLNLAPGLASAAAVPLPQVLLNTQVIVNGVVAPLYFVSTGQINFQMPVEIFQDSVSVSVKSGALTSPFSTVQIAPLSPGIFSAQPGGIGQGAVLNQDSSANSAANPAAAGSVIQIFATGLGATDAVIATGAAGATAEPFNRTVVNPAALIGGVSVPAQFSAVAPGFIGLYQVNVQIPGGSSANPAATLQLQSAGVKSNTVTIAIK